MINKEFDYTLIEEFEEKEKFPSFPLPIFVTKAEGSYLSTANKKKYLDLTSNKDNNPLGYSSTHSKTENRFFDSGLFNTALSEKLEESLKSLTGLDKAYFSSSNEELYGLTRNLINTYLNNTQKSKLLISSLSADKKLYEIKDVECELIPANKDSLLKTTFSRAVGAIVIQLAQINDEILIPDDEYLKEVRMMCDRNNALLIFDSSGISPLRLNKGLFNYNSEIKPDILIISKGFANGFPFGTVITSKNVPVEENFDSKTGIYSAAYSEAEELTKNFKNGKLREVINSNTEYITEKLADSADTHISIVDYYSFGMLFTIVVDISAYDVAKELFDKGVIVDTQNDNKIIFSPPYNIKKEETDYFISVFDKVLDKLAKFDRLK